jgi:hypothetical protein
MGTLTGFDPVSAGFRVATPIRRRKRRPSSRATPKPQYADAVLYSFQQGTPLEVSVRTSAVEDTVRKLKRAARYQERTTGREVRVQISVEPVMVQATGANGQPEVDGKGDPVMVLAKPAKSTVKFLGHEPWMLGRRISKARAEELGAAEPDAPAPAAVPGQHRRTVAETRPRHARTALHHAMVRAVITTDRPLAEMAGGLSFSRARCRCQVVI